MRLLLIIRVALRSLRRILLRASLTALGIVIGVAAVITMVSLGSGAKAKMEETLSSMTWNYVVVMANLPLTEWRGGQRPPMPHGKGLTLQDYEAIRDKISSIALITPRAYLDGAQAKAGRRSLEPRVTGWNSSGFELHSRRILRGVSFGDVDVRRATSVCLITEAVERTFFPNANAIGQTVLLNGVPFLILGVVEGDKSFEDPQKPEGEEAIFAPVTSILRRLDPDAEMDIAISTQDRRQVARLKIDLADLMESRRGGRKVEFKIFHQMEGIEQLAEGSRTMTRLLAAIAGVSLLVGGIGIMNIMLVSVTERTREIGIRLSVGTRQTDVLKQFVIEAIILSLLGGSIGIVLGISVAQLLTRMNGWPTQLTAAAVLAAFLCSACIGIFFGYYPARQAARVDPIQALRSE